MQCVKIVIKNQIKYNFDMKEKSEVTYKMRVLCGIAWSFADGIRLH